MKIMKGRKLKSFVVACAFFYLLFKKVLKKNKKLKAKTNLKKLKAIIKSVIVFQKLYKDVVILKY